MSLVQHELAAVEKAKAYQVGEYLLLRLTGVKPNGCYVVDLLRSLLTVEPPTFIAAWYVPPDAMCIPEEIPYEYQEAFRVGIKRDEVTLQHAGGELSVPVEDLSPEVESVVAAMAARPGPGRIPIGKTEAVGYSQAFDFNEAFRDAIGKIPTPRIPDWLATYTVLDVGAQIGGIAGFNHLYVRVLGG
ncbi:MAG: hypothetical protein M3144_05400 [Actinomycetota bacterium]|nr:hypothetical protein [Actinomycetota bacterium]